MNNARLTLDKKEKILNKVSINMWWLLGFVEGEGTFGYRHLVPYFQLNMWKIGLKAIERYLSNLFKKYTSITGNPEFNVTYTLNKGTGVYSMTVTNIDTIYEYIIPLFESTPFYTRKKVDYFYLVISVIICKYGYYCWLAGWLAWG